MEYSKGKIVEGKIIHVAEEYLLVKFPSKETGILYKSKMSPQPESNLTNLYRKNQSILVSIDRITEKGYILGQKDIENRYENQLRHEEKEKEKQKMAEERKRMQDLVEMNASQFERGAVYEAEVIRLSNQIARISINGIEGYIEKEELNWNENESVKESLFEGEIIRVVFLEYKDGKLLFGLKYLEEKPYDDDLYSLSTIDLLNRLEHTSSVFIAEAKNVKGLCLTNLYSEEGNLLVDPIKGNNIVIRFVQPTIEEGKFYKVQVELIKESKRRENNDLFSFYVSKAEEIANPYKADVEKAFSWHRSPESNSSLANILDTVGLEMYSSAERMFFELIQNADDASSKDGVAINIDRIDNYLIFTHNGFHFNYKDFRSLVSAAKSTKSSKEKTGYKGIGFKSVFTNSQQVFVHSGGYHFKFDKEEPLFDDFDKFYSLVNSFKSEEQLLQFVDDFKIQRDTFRGVKDIPWQLLPIWYDAIPEILKKSAFAKNQKVSFALNIKNQKVEDYVKAIEYLFDNPKFILFLRHTNRLDLKFVNKTISKDVKDGIVTIKNSFANKKTEVLIKRDFEDISVSNDAFANKDVDIVIREITNRQGETEKKFYDTNNQELEDIPDRIASSQTTTISFVANYDNGSITENKGNSLYAYLPMNEHRFRFPFFINADFVLAANRETLLDSPWNYYLLANIGQLLVEWVAELAKKGERNCLKLLPLQYFDDSTLDVEQLAQSFNSAYRTALESESFILNHKGDLARQDEIIIDKTGLSEIVGADLFCQLLDTRKYLPSEKIDSKNLEKDILEYIETLKFDDVIKAITNNSDFNDWFASATDEQKKALYSWIDKNDITSRKNDLLSFVANLPLFRFFDTEYSSYRSINSDKDEITPLITTSHILPIRGILNKIDFQCSDDLFDENHPLFKYIDLPKEDNLFNSIKNCDFSELTVDERKTLFFALVYFDGIGDAKLKKDIALFKNLKGEFKPLGEMVAYRENVPIWLNDYVLCKDEYSSNFDKYLISNEHVFQEVIQTHYSDLEYSSVLELYDHFKTQWTSTFTKTLIDKYGPTDDLLTIVERTDGAKRYFIEKYGRINLDNTTTADSIEYRLIRLALSSNHDVNKLKGLIFIDNRNITEFTVAPDVSITLDKKYLFPISEILPSQSENYTTFNRIKDLLSDINGSDSLFSLTRMKNSDVRKQLKELSTPAQYAFYVCYNIANGYRYTISISDEEFATTILDYFFDNRIDELRKYISYFSNQKIIGRFINSDDYTLETERLSNVIRVWADNEEKEKFLLSLGVKNNLSGAIKRRKAFLNNEPISLSYANNISSEISTFLNWCITLKTPFIKENQVKVLKEMFVRLNLKTQYCNDDYCNAKEWNNERYIEHVKNKLPIYCIDNKMPKRGVYKDVHIFTEYVGNYLWRSPNRLYINNKDKNIETVLMSVCDNKDIPFTKDDWTKIFMVSVDSLKEKESEIIKKDNKINSLEDENRKKDKIIEELKAELNVYKNIDSNNEVETKTNPHIPTIQVGEFSGIEKEIQWEAQLEAQKRLIQEFPQWTFPPDYGKADDNGKPYNFSTIEVVDEYNNTIPVVLKSYKKSSEPFKINTEEWDYLIREQAVLLIYTGADVKRVYVRDLIRKQSCITITFSTENLDIEDKINAFADSLHYFNELHFDFESFNISSRVQSAAELYKRNKRAFFANDNTEDDI